MAAPLAAAVAGRGHHLRATGVTGRAAGGRNISIQVIGLRDAAKVPEELRATFDAMMRRLEHNIETAAREVVPGGAEGTLGRQVHARTVRGKGVSNRIVIGTVGSEFAAALNRGFTAPSRNFNGGEPTGRSLRGFDAGGKTVFTRRVRVAGRHFYAKWLQLTPPIVEATYERSFYDIRDLY